MISTKLRCVYKYIYMIIYVNQSVFRQVEDTGSPAVFSRKLENHRLFSATDGLWISTHPPLSVQEIGGPPCKKKAKIANAWRNMP